MHLGRTKITKQRISHYSAIRCGREGGAGAAPQLLMMPCCGGLFYFPTEKAFPKSSLPCPCGKRNYFVVFYEESA